MERKHPIALWMEANGGLSQPAAAERLGITQQEVSAYVTWRNIPRPAKLARLAALIGVSAALFLPDHKPARRSKVA